MRIKSSSLLWLGIILTPLWWVLGLLQFIWLPLISGVLMFRFIKHRKFQLSFEILLLTIFLIVQMFSLLSISETYRYVTFSKTFGGYFTILLLFIYVSTFNEYKMLLKVLIKSIITLSIYFFIVSLITQFYWLFNKEIIQFNSFFYHLVPEWIRGTSLGQAAFSPSTGRIDWFFGITYLRHTGMNLFATTYSMALAAMLPILLWASTSREIGLSWRWRLAAKLGFVGGAIVLLLTTGRMSMLGLLLGAAWYGLVRWPRLRLAAVLGLVAAIVFTVFWGSEYAVEFLYARGEGSAVTRYQIYAQTWVHYLEKPLFGWGSEVDVENLGYPLGSHSQYLAVLFRFGLAGIISWLAWMAALWMRLRSINSKEAQAYLGWSIIAVFTNGLTDVWDLDLFTLFILSLIFSIVYLTYKITRRSLTEDANRMVV